jgi:hypothetical protein
MTFVKASSALDPASLLVHEINNMTCSIRMRTSGLSAESNFHEAADEILEASRQIEKLVTSLASLAKGTAQPQKPDRQHKDIAPK